ncbi:hypothetical protein [Kitasatospora sp. NPDC056731]|uniref:hypothetical protein n=1 Tax=Kitasatospora sp. NPDC056731 TaxID=3155422 RepID=UPI00344A6D9B
MKHSGPLIAGGTALLLGSGLLGWHLYLDHTEYRPPAVELSHGECKGALADPDVAELLGGTPRVFVSTRYRSAQPNSPAALDCTLTGERGRVLLAAVTKGSAAASGDNAGAVAFTCTLNGTTTPYRASLRLTDKTLHATDSPSPARMGELATGFARRTAETFGCANGAESLTTS